MSVWIQTAEHTLGQAECKRRALPAENQQASNTTSTVELSPLLSPPSLPSDSRPPSPRPPLPSRSPTPSPQPPPPSRSPTPQHPPLPGIPLPAPLRRSPTPTSPPPSPPLQRPSHPSLIPPRHATPPPSHLPPPESPAALPWTNDLVATPRDSPSPSHQETHRVSRPLPDYLGWPKDLLKIYKYLTRGPAPAEEMPRDWGQEWADCVEEYMKFQGISGFPVSHNKRCTPDGRLMSS